jgi:hypothetical protein
LRAQLHLAVALQASPHALEFRERLQHGFVPDLELLGDADRRERIEHVVRALAGSA